MFAYILMPLMFLAAIGFGVGGLVEDNQSTVEGVTYLVFVTPGLLAASAMQGAAGESLWPIMAGTKWIRVFHAMVATPIRPSDVCIGVLLWTTARAAAGAAVFLVIAGLLGGIDSFWAPLAIPAAALYRGRVRRAAGRVRRRAGDRLPVPGHHAARDRPAVPLLGHVLPGQRAPRLARSRSGVLSPLWHGVELCRAATTGIGDLLALAGSVLFLGALVVAGQRVGHPLVQPEAGVMRVSS